MAEISTKQEGIMRKYLIILLSALALTSCGEYNKVLKSTDPNLKLEFAKRAFEQKKYVQQSVHASRKYMTKQLQKQSASSTAAA